MLIILTTALFCCCGGIQGGSILQQSPGVETEFPCEARPVIEDTADPHVARNPRNVKIFKCSGFTDTGDYTYSISQNKLEILGRKAVEIDQTG